MSFCVLPPEEIKNVIKQASPLFFFGKEKFKIEERFNAIPQRKKSVENKLKWPLKQ